MDGGRHLLTTGLPALLAGDFNTLLGPEDKRGGAPFRITADVYQFRQWLNANKLQSLIVKGGPYTWCNNRKGQARTLEVLDRAIATTSWFDLFPTAVSEVLPRHASDHAPLLIYTSLPTPSGPNPFRFERFWLDYSSLGDIVKYGWNMPSYASPMGMFQQKLRNLQRSLRQWHRSQIGNLQVRVHEAHQQLQQLMELESHQSVDSPISDSIRSTSNKLSALQRQSEMYWAQRARIQWLKEGDKNTRYFQHRVQRRRIRNRINMVRTSEGIIIMIRNKFTIM
ncbi:hypothetical protein QJS10_CPA08g01386 [Acorus calamus]|uniref:Endonuclease/exonuclease/phosphatase domain-containing protein n=1 Tax=Acorus calamus TaxID=4465 RepID=A0AAV9E9L6_ACOCL|nr:hypothetical protein QJS10_CPA08g01386 [Acorus calamus]